MAVCVLHGPSIRMTCVVLVVLCCTPSNIFGLYLGTFDHVASEVILGIRLEKKANGKAILFR